jgi:hypothetical protein
MVEAALSRYLERQAALAGALLGMCTPLDEFVEAVDQYVAVLEQQAEGPADAELLDGLRKQKDFFQGIREHLWQIGTSLSRREPQSEEDGAFHALLHDFDPGEKEIN